MTKNWTKQKKKGKERQKRNREEREDSVIDI